MGSQPHSSVWVAAVGSLLPWPRGYPRPLLSFQFNPCPSWLRDLPSAKPRVTERNNLVLHQASFHGLLLQCRWLPVLLHPALPIPTCLNSFGGGPVLSGVRGGRRETSKGP